MFKGSICYIFTWHYDFLRIPCYRMMLMICDVVNDTFVVEVLDADYMLLEKLIMLCCFMMMMQHPIWYMMVVEDPHGLALFLVINIIFFSWCKGHVKTHDVIIVKISHVLTIGVKSIMYLIPLFWAFDVMLSQICNPIVLGY